MNTNPLLSFDGKKPIIVQGEEGVKYFEQFIPPHHRFTSNEHEKPNIIVPNELYDGIKFHETKE